MTERPYRVVPKSWGREEWIANGPAYCAKVLVIEPGKRTSVHYHARKLETLYLAKGRLVVYHSGAEDYDPNADHFAMEPGQQVTIQPYQRHGFFNVGDVPAVLFEASTQHFDDDSFRIIEAPK